MTKVRIIATLLITLSVLVSCKDDENKDIRNDAVGAYDYLLKFYYIDQAGALIYLGDNFNETGTFDVYRNADESSSIDVGESGTLIFTGTAVTQTSNGFTFTIPAQTLSDNGLEYEIEGYDGFEVNGVKSSGGYNKTFKSFAAYFKKTGYVYINDVKTEVKIVSELSGVKK